MNTSEFGEETNFFYTPYKGVYAVDAWDVEVIQSTDLPPPVMLVISYYKLVEKNNSSGEKKRKRGGEGRRGQEKAIPRA